MAVFYIFLIIAGVYFFTIFVVLRFVTPFMGFGDMPIPKEIPKAIKTKITELENKSQTPLEYLKSAYAFVSSRWHAGRLETVSRAPLAFRKNLEQIWNRPGYAHCNTQNYLLFVLLTGSKFFKPEDIKPKCVIFNFFIHQYLRIKVSGAWIKVDPAGASIRGLSFGSYIEYFG